MGRAGRRAARLGRRRVKCAVTGPVLWGDGEHDDTAALNAWFRGDRVVWARTGRPVGPQIGGSQSGEAGLGGRVFRLTGPVYIPSGTGRRIEQFEFVWPQRRERVSGGTIMAGADPAKPPVATNLVKIGTRPGEGVPFKTPDPKPGESRCRDKLPRLLMGLTLPGRAGRARPRRPRAAAPRLHSGVSFDELTSRG